MAGPLDHQIGIAAESTFGTAVTVSRFLEPDFTSVEHSWDPNAIQGSGMQVGDGGFERASRSVGVVGKGSGKFGFDLQTKGLGLLLNGLFGTGVSTLVSGTTYQQVFTSGLTTALLPSHTVQYGVVRSDASGTVDAYTYRGVTMGKLTLGVQAGEVTKGEVEWDAIGQSTATALATASYPAGLGRPVHFADWSATVGGSVTVPTTTALASGGTPAASLKSFEFELDNAIDTERWVLGGTRLQQRTAKRSASLKLAVEYDATTMDGYQVAHTTVPVVLTATTDIALSTGFAQVQLVFPACKVTSASRPNPAVETPSAEYELKVGKPDTGHAIYLVIRTSDTAL